MTAPVSTNSDSTAIANPSPINVNNGQVIKHPTMLNFGALIQPFEGSSTNGGHGGAFSQLVSGTFSPVDTLAGGNTTSIKSLIPLGLIIAAVLVGINIIRRTR